MDVEPRPEPLGLTPTTMPAVYAYRSVAGAASARKSLADRVPVSLRSPRAVQIGIGRLSSGHSRLGRALWENSP